MQDDSINVDRRGKSEGEKRWTKGLEDPQYLAYWIGFMSDSVDVSILQKTINFLQVGRYCLCFRLGICANLLL